MPVIMETLIAEGRVCAGTVKASAVRRLLASEGLRRELVARDGTVSVGGLDWELACGWLSRKRVTIGRSYADPTLEGNTSAPRPMGPDEPPHSSMAATHPSLSSISRGALSRQDPRQEPGAVVPHAGICAGGGPTPKC